MDIGISTACFFPIYTDDTIEIISDLGFKKIEVFLQSESEYDEDFCKRLKENADKKGIEIVSFHAFCAAFEPFIFSDYGRRRQDYYNIFKKAVNAGKLLGAKYYTFHGARMESTTPHFNYSKFAKEMDELADFVYSHGIYLAWENVSWCQSGSGEFVSRALEHMKSDKLRFTLDIKQSMRCDTSFEKYIKIFGDKLCNVHINDYHQTNGCKLPSFGELDLGSVVAKTLQNGYDGDFIIEVYSNNYKEYSEISESYENMKKILKKFST